uniref:PDZ domain-containing protein n=1 Tax=Timema monikensis TaxID=170555 RepID=A0A7R9ECI4_9NEOP|nr:unnamed protein product [Timema monikensis]
MGAFFISCTIVELSKKSWRCSICRRKMQSRAQPVLTQESMDTLLDVPVVEALQRRHSDVKIGSGSSGNSGRAKSAAFRRPLLLCSQMCLCLFVRMPMFLSCLVSACSSCWLLSLCLCVQVGGEEEVDGGGLGAGLAPPRSPELRRHSDVSPASLKELEKVAGERREELRWEREMEWRQHKRGSSPGGRGDQHLKTDEMPRPRSGSVCPIEQPPEDPEEEEEWRRRRGRTRRKSRVQKQHSYDDDLKNDGSAPSSGGDVGLGLPVQLPRRASAYDVYATRDGGGGGGGGGLNAMAMAAAVASVRSQQEANPEPNPGRRPSFRAGKPPGLYDFDNNNQDDPKGLQSPLSPEGAPVLMVDDDRRTRRRGSQLPALPHPLPVISAVAPVPRPPLHDGGDSVRRQASVADGEAIKIVIHDVDSEANLGARPGSKRRVVLRRDPGDKGHRTRGFGMRVVGGKTGNDGRLFAYIVWTVPGGPAEKGGLQQGDKVLEWDGMPLVDRSFEEVCAVMDRAGEVAELLVEHATDLRMCDLLDDPSASGSGPRKSGDSLGAQSGKYVTNSDEGGRKTRVLVEGRVCHLEFKPNVPSQTFYIMTGTISRGSTVSNDSTSPSPIILAVVGEEATVQETLLVFLDDLPFGESSK